MHCAATGRRDLVREAGIGYHRIGRRGFDLGRHRGRPGRLRQRGVGEAKRNRREDEEDDTHDDATLRES